MIPAITSATFPGPATQQEESRFLALPWEVIQKQILELNLQAIGRLRQVCKPLNEWLQNDLNWKPMLLRDYPLHESQEGAQQDYRRSHLLRSNLINGVFRSVKLGKHHSLNSTPNLAVVGNKLISSVWNEPMRMWDLKTKENDFLETPTAFATGDDQILFLGNWGGGIDAYNLQTRAHIFTLLHATHNGLVESMAYSNGKLFSAGKRGAIKVWDWAAVKKSKHGFGEGCVLKELQRENVGSLSLAVSGNTLICLDGIGAFKLWDLTTYECTHQFVYPAYTCHTLAGNRLIIGLNNGEIVILSIENGTVLHRIAAHDGDVDSITAWEGTFFSEHGSERKIWDLERGELLQTIFCGDYWGLYYAHSEGTLFYINSSQEIWEANYLADDDEIFADIALLFRTGKGLARFYSMPKQAREQIYLKFAALYPMDHSKQPEEHFNHRSHLYPERRAEAIEAYLAERKEKQGKK